MNSLIADEIREITERYWQAGKMIQHIGTENLPSPKHDRLPWVKHECMRAKLIEITPGKIGELVIQFPPEGKEDLEMHSHPISDRIITVLEGGGVFLAQNGEETIESELIPGDVVYMPRGIFHTFIGGKDPLLVHAIHNPWVPFEHPLNLVYPDGTTTRMK
ncbi:hypothetical protein NUACC21_36060 [Scytonema sp. NUACC21]